MKLVYRFETDTGTGIYNVAGPAGNAIRRDFDAHKHPGPYEDSKLEQKWHKLSLSGEYRKYKFGFVSMEQLRAWFYNDRTINTAYDQGVQVSVYAVPDVACHIGNAQAVFHEVYHTPADRLRVLTRQEVLDGIDKALDGKHNTPSSIHHVNWTQGANHV